MGEDLGRGDAITLRHLRLAEAIARLGSLSRASAELHISQPVLTRTLHQLEDALGVQLFERGNRGMAATVFGDSVAAHARLIESEISTMSRRIDEIASAKIGSVAVGVHAASAHFLLPRAIRLVKERNPLILITVNEGTPAAVFHELLSGAIDLVVGHLPATDEGVALMRTFLHDEPIALTVRRGHPAVRDGLIRLADLVGYPWVFPTEDTFLRQELDEVFLRSELSIPTDLVMCTSPLLVSQLLLSTDSIAALPASIGIDDERLDFIEINIPVTVRKIGATLVAGRPVSPATNEFLRALSDAVPAPGNL